VGKQQKFVKSTSTWSKRRWVRPPRWRW